MTHKRARNLAGIAILAGALAQAHSTQAGPGDTPLPTFADGKPAQAVYVALGVIKNNNLETDVVCTSLDGSPVDIGFQVFDETVIRLPEFHAAACFVVDPDGQLIELVQSPGDPAAPPRAD